MPFEDVEDVALALDEAVEFLGNYWLSHNVDEARKEALKEAYFMVKEAAESVWKLESLLERMELEKILGESRKNEEDVHEQPAGDRT